MTPTTPNPNFDKEQSEGSRETVDEAVRTSSNKPAADEQRQQDKVPPRGQASRRKQP
jgi:hypothetical protein